MKKTQTKLAGKIISMAWMAGVLSASLGSGTIAAADDATPTDKKLEEKKKNWESIATAGLTLTRGNSENLLANAAIGTKRKWADDELLLGASAGYGDTTTRQSDGTKVDAITDSYVKGFGQW